MVKTMAKELTLIDVTHSPELLHVAQEVRRSGEARVLRRDREDLAVVVPRRGAVRGVWAPPEVRAHGPCV